MPLLLTTPYNAGDLDGSLTHVKITQFGLNPDEGLIDLVTRMGIIDDGNWVYKVAVEGKTVRRFTISGEDYNTMVAAESAAAEEVYYNKVSNLLYQWLIDKGHFVGTIV